MMYGDKARVIFGLPFFEIVLKDRSGHMYKVISEAHFSRRLDERAILLVVKEKTSYRLKSQVYPMSVTLPFRFESSWDYLDFMWNNYLNLLNRLSSISERREGFSLGFAFSESLRIFFGGWMSRPPEPQLNERSKAHILIGLYEEALRLKEGKPLIVEELKTVVPFEYEPLSKQVRYLGPKKDRMSSLAKILNRLLREGTIELSV